MTPNRPIRVLIVDDSAIVRRIVTDALAHEPDFQVVGEAPDPFVARDKILELKPDVLTLDIEMPRMDGLTFLRKIMKFHPMPVVIVSSLGQAGCAAALEALEAGAVDVLAKPAGPYSMGDLTLVLAQKLRAASHVKRFRTAGPVAVPAAPAASADEGPFRNIVIAIGASTGGTDAIQQILCHFPKNAPAVLVTQHLPAKFSAAFAERLNHLCAMEVKEAGPNDEVVAGRVLIAPGDLHLVLQPGRRVLLNAGPRICYQRPSVDVLFSSVAVASGSQAIGVLLTGMGADGAQGLLRMRSAGAMTLAQDEASSIVFGMPKEAVRLGAAEGIVPLSRMASEILRRARIGAPTHHDGPHPAHATREANHH
jgi:two-component system chemotaxis response regulator CheB